METGTILSFLVGGLVGAGLRALAIVAKRHTKQLHVIERLVTRPDDEETLIKRLDRDPFYGRGYARSSRT